MAWCRVHQQRTANVLCMRTRNTSTIIPCNPEEADSRIMIHGADAVRQGFHKILVRTVDTDVVMLAAGLRSRIRSRSRMFLGGVGFLATLGVGVGFFRPTPTPKVQLDHFLHHTLQLRIPVEIVQFILKLSLKRRFLAVHHDFHWF